MLSRWPIRNKLLIGIALLLVIVVTLSISGFQGSYAYRYLVRGLSSRVTELPKATELLRQVGDLRVYLAELRTEAAYSDLAFSPTGQNLAESFRQQFVLVKQTVKKYRDELDEHKKNGFSIDNITGDDSREWQEWQQLSEIDQCLESIDLLTTDPPARNINSDENALSGDVLGSPNEVQLKTENESQSHSSDAIAAAESEQVEGEPLVNLGARYQGFVAPRPRPQAWYCDSGRLSQIANDELIRLQNAASELPSYLQGQMHDLAGEVRLTYRIWISLTWFCAVAATVLTTLFIVLVYRWVFRPLRCLVKGSRRVASGDFNYRIELASRDEMGELAEAMNDMTSRFRTIRDDLDRQVQLRTKQVVRSEQLASVGFLAAGVAHEINNPLASIAMCAESLESRLSELAPAESEQAEVVGRYLRMIQSEAFRCKGITEKLLDFSRVGEVVHQSADLRELVQTVIEMVRHLGKYQDRHIEFPDGQPVIAQINVQEIKQVVLNLVTNALDSVDADGKLTIALRRNGRFAEMTFTDNGCGMSDEVLKHLFEPFFTRKRGGQGTGLGLSIVYRIVSDHGGQIEATSAGLGHGSQFVVTLPLAEAGRKEVKSTIVNKENSHRYQAA